MKKVKITQEDLDNNPILKELGAKAGDTMEYSFVPSGKTKTDGKSESNEGKEGDKPVQPRTGGPQPPPDKERP